MRICDMDPSEIHVGLKMRGLKNPNRIGTVVKIDVDDDCYAWVLWEGDDQPYGGFYWNDCRCEVVDE